MDELLHELMRCLKQDEAGINEHGPYWRSSELVKTLRWFYKEYNKLYN